MLKTNKKISVRQMFLLNTVIILAPSIRLLSNYSAKYAKQATWVVPAIYFVIYLISIVMFDKLLKNYKNKSFIEIILDITTTPIGKIILSFYAIWMSILLSLYVRYYAERLVGSLYPYTRIEVFVVVMLLIVSFILKSGIVVIARMNEVIFAVIIIIIIFLVSLMIPNVSILSLTPISYLDIIPSFKGTLGLSALFYLPYILFFANEVSDMDNFLREGIIFGIFTWFITTMVIIASIGTVGHDMLSSSPLPFLIAVKYINLLDIIGGFESILIPTWIVADCILICVFTYSILSLVKAIFNLDDHKPYINIYLLFIYFSSFSLGYSMFEIKAFSVDLGIQVNSIIQIILPMLIFAVGIFRKKIRKKQIK